MRKDSTMMATNSDQLQPPSSIVVNIDQIGSASKLSIVGEDDFLTSTLTTASPQRPQIRTTPAAERGKDSSRDSDAETDLEIELADATSKKSARYDSSGRNVYLGACRMFNQVPVSYFLRHGDNETMRLRHHSVGPLGVKAICVALVSNTTIEVLDLHDNGLENTGCAYVAEMLKENYFITELIISNNSIGYKGAQALFETIRQSDSLVKLDISGNNLGDRSALDIREALFENTKLTHLNLRCNSLGEIAGDELGQMLILSFNLTHLDLSFNNIRTKGVQLFFAGLKKNTSLVYLNFAENGIGMDGCLEVSRTLKENCHLVELNISNNRIPQAGMVILAKGLRSNTTLQILDVSRNPCQVAGCMVILEVFQKTASSALRYLSFNGILVHHQFCEIQQSLENERFILISHGGLMESWKNKQKPSAIKETTRDVLCFLTNKECQQIAENLQTQDQEHKGKATLKAFSNAIDSLGWKSSSKEIMQRLERRAKDHSFAEYISLLSD